MWNISRSFTQPLLSYSLGPSWKEHTKKKKHTYFYMDNLKLISTTEEELKKQIQTVRTFSDDIHVEFRLNKCAKTVLKKGKLVHSQNLMLDINREIEEQGKTCKYLWTEGS